MKKCLYCQSANNNNALVCVRCGASEFDTVSYEPDKIPVATAQQAVTHNYYYYNQNVSQQIEAIDEYEYEEEPPKKYWGLKIIGWLFLVLQVLLMLIDFGMYAKLTASVAVTIVALRKKKWLLLFIAIFLWMILIGS